MTDAALGAYVALAGTLAVPVYSYLGYPVLLRLLSLGRRRAVPPPRHAASARALPFVSITIPAYNEAAAIADTLECILRLDYPAHRRQIVVVSDASTDGTDEIVARWAGRGVELLRLSRRGGKTAAENAARARLKGDIVVNTDASVRVHPQALRALVAALADRSVGVASGRDVSVDHLEGGAANPSRLANQGEGTYVGYEMWVRDLETRVSGIVGASGCLYAIRAELHQEAVPENLSRDFAAALIARRRGFRAVSVPEAVCFVPRSASLRQEYRRKVRTMARGLRTLWHMRALLNPARYGAFAWSLASHKLCRWLVPWSLAGAVAALVALWVGGRSPWAATVIVAIGSVALVAAVGWAWPGGRPLPRLVSLPAYLVSGTVAALHAWVLALGGERTAVWEPTRRGEPTSHRAA